MGTDSRRGRASQRSKIPSRAREIKQKLRERSRKMVNEYVEPHLPVGEIFEQRSAKSEIGGTRREGGTFGAFFYLRPFPPRWHCPKMQFYKKIIFAKIFEIKQNWMMFCKFLNNSNLRAHWKTWISEWLLQSKNLLIWKCVSTTTRGRKKEECGAIRSQPSYHPLKDTFHLF